ncbi:InlB B-repeat-containing protein [Flavonifractor plautii]|uniref:InlB B-repeat-containing protein n=3 Tax=Flavonifractor plautii TaxID=292800 RepID=A0AAW6C4E6_FLAPL|nr:InlB B-repeat-containing protein [Flavonifractor plautii]MDB7906955.1 InlB B-repeat-containing protein [Flavonifractor plautii]
MKKRILSILLLCCMVLTLLPTAAFAAGEIDEQFTLAPGGTYYFDLSAMGIPGTVNDALPDKTMRYVPFTYAGTVDSYKLTSEMATTEEYAETYKYAHSLFIADFAVTHEVSWDELNAGRLIFGKDCAAGGVEYMLRAPSVGSDSAGSGDSQHGTPQSNEWDRILDKNDGYIKNWSRMHSWGQDISRSSWTTRAFRGYISARYWTASWSESSRPSVGFRPVLEILNPGTLGSDGLKAVTLDLGGGKLGNSFKDIQIIVKKGSEFTAPASDGLTRPDGNADSYFQWLGSDGKLYAPGDSVPADVIKLTAQFDFKEQFTLAPGGVYYFDLSGVSIPGTANGSLPDKTMHYVPFTYAGTVVAYKLTSEMATTEEYAQQNEYAHSLFVADYAVTHAVSWDNLNAEGLIFGKGYATGSVDYTLRAPSGGSGGTGSGALERGTPQSNEWDRILDKDDGYIKNWRNIGSWGQDTLPNTLSNRVIRGQDDLPRTYAGANTTLSFPFLGFRPVLEVLNPGTLGSDGLKAVTLDLGGGKLGGSSDTIQIVVKTGESFAAPASEGLTRPDGNTGSYFEWLGSDGELYEPGDNVSADVSKLTAQFAPSSHSVTITTDTLPDGKVGETYSQTLTADGTAPITWSIENGGLPTGLSLNKDTGEISGTPTADGTAKFTVKAENSVGSDTKELSITITKAAPAEFTISVKTDGNGTASASLAKAAAGTEITLSATPNEGYHFKEWKVESPTGLVITNNKFTMPNNNVEVKAIFEEDTPPAPTEHTVTVTSGGNGTASASPDKAVAGAEITLSATPDKGYHLKEWQVESPTGLVITNNKFTMPDSDVEVKAIFEEDAPPAPTEHTVTVTSSGNGTASASPAKAVAGAEITLSATPDKGYHLKEWQVISGGVSIKDNKFTMPNNNVEIKAIFEKDAPPTPTEYTVTVTSGGNGTASASPAKAVAGAEITLSATPDKGYHLKEWQVESPTGLVITNNKFTMPDSDVEVKAIFEEDAPPAPTDPAKPSISVTGTYTYNGSEHTAAVNGYDPSTMNISGNTATDAGDYTVRVTSKTGKWADGSTDAVTAAWSIGKATREAPDGLIGVAPSTEGGSDGKITGVTDEMEYRMADERIYTACSGTEIENLSAGHYFVRYAENNNHFASSDAAITVGEGTPLADCTITFNGNGGSGSMDSVTVKAGTNYILPDCGFTAPADQEFKAWEISGAEYKVGDSYTVDRDTEIKALWENSVITPTTYTVTVGNDGNGTASASHAKAVVGTEIALTATPNKGYHFKEWQVISGGVTIKDNKFTMSNDNVEVKAIFEKDAPPAPTEHTVTVTSSGNGTASASPAKAVAGAEITLTATPNKGYHFKEWQVMSGGVTIKDDKFLMPSANVDVKAIFEEDVPAPTEFIVTFDGNGGTPSVVSMTTTNQKLTSLPSASRSGSYSFDGWYTDKSGGTKITTDTVFSANTTVYAHWTYIGGGGGYNPPVTYYTLRFETGGGSDIPSVREAYNTYIDLTKYVPTWRGHTFIGWYTERSLMNKVSGVYLTKDMTVYAGWRVNENPGTGANPFTDVSEKDWFYSDVMFVYENGLMLGTSKTLFSPHGTATRGMMATILWRMEGSPVPKGKNSFTDVEAEKWYADAITWTAENGIFAGYGKDKFGPDDPITREQLAAIFYRYADYKGYDLTVKGNLDKFKDADKITDYAKTAMQWAVGSGLMKGKSGNLLDPQGTATRAEIAAMLHRFIEKYELVQGKAPGGLMGWIDPKRLQIPKTGDSSVLGLWGFSLCTSLAGCLALTTWQIRRRREEEALQIIEK